MRHRRQDAGGRAKGVGVRGIEQGRIGDGDDVMKKKKEYRTGGEAVSYSG